MFRVDGRIAVATSAELLTLTGAWRLGSATSIASAPVRTAALDSLIMRTYQWRLIGPDKGGRSIGATGVKGRPQEAYFGATGGGLWKTTNGGNDWLPVTDGQIGSTSVGAVAVSESNPDVVYIGTGETCIRGNIIPGDGVYKSTDAGKTWTKVGFSDRQNISKIRIHPTNPDIVWVAAFGYHGAPNDERGVFKTTDGGRTWRKVLFRDNKTGAIDISVDRSNPNVLYAALWQAYRNEYKMESGGPGSGLFKSTDGGESCGRSYRCRRVGRRSQSGVCAGRERERRAVLLRQRRQHVDAHQQQPQHPATRLLLHARYRRSEEPRRRLPAERVDVQVDRRR